MNSQEAKELVRNGLAALEREPSRWARGAYLMHDGSQWCMCLLGAAYCMKQYGKLEPEKGIESDIDAFVGELENAWIGIEGEDLCFTITEALIDANDTVRGPCPSPYGLKRLRERVEEILR